MKAVILAAGLGKRMRPLTDKKPKALVRLGGKPLLEHVLESLKKAGIEETLLVVGFGADKIMKRFGKNFNGMKLSYVEQKIAMGTAHAVLQAKGRVKGRFLVGHADVIVLPSLWKSLAAAKGFDAVVALRLDPKPERYGVALVSGKKLVQIVEKPSAKLESNLVNAAAYLFSQKVFPALEETKVSERGEFELTDSINALAAKGKAGFVLYKGKCIDIGTVEELREAGKGE